MTLIEVLSALAIMGFLAMFLLPAMANTLDAAHRSACAANLSRLGMALRMYAQDNDGYLPDCGACSSACGPVPCDGRHVASRLNAPGTCNWGRVRAVGNQANLWMLVRLAYAAPPVFICPATADRPSLNSPSSSSIMGFLAMDPSTGRPTPAEERFLKRVTGGHCSYSYQCQFVHPGADPNLVEPLNATTNVYVHAGNLPILADRNPYTRTDLVRQPIVSPETDPESNSLNHGRTGQNVLFLDGDVQWSDTPRCGLPRFDGLRDNIYWPASAPDAEQPTLPTDPLAVPYDLIDTFVAP